MAWIKLYRVFVVVPCDYESKTILTRSGAMVMQCDSLEVISQNATEGDFYVLSELSWFSRRMCVWIFLATKKWALVHTEEFKYGWFGGPINATDEFRKIPFERFSPREHLSPSPPPSLSPPLPPSLPSPLRLSSPVVEGEGGIVKDVE